MTRSSTFFRALHELHAFSLSFVESLDYWIPFWFYDTLRRNISVLCRNILREKLLPQKLYLAVPSLETAMENIRTYLNFVPARTRNSNIYDLMMRRKYYLKIHDFRRSHPSCSGMMTSEVKIPGTRRSNPFSCQCFGISC